MLLIVGIGCDENVVSYSIYTYIHISVKLRKRTRTMYTYVTGGSALISGGITGFKSKGPRMRPSSATLKVGFGATHSTACVTLGQQFLAEQTHSIDSM